jgi:hypothetical protein
MFKFSFLILAVFAFRFNFTSKIFSMKSLKMPKGNTSPYIEEKQTTQWLKEKIQKDKQRSTKHTYKTKDRVTRTPLKTGVNSGAPEECAVSAPLVAPVMYIS